MRSILAVTIAAILIAGGLTALGTAVANADNPYDPALKRPPLPGRTMTVPRRPCATPSRSSIDLRAARTTWRTKVMTRPTCGCASWTSSGASSPRLATRSKRRVMLWPKHGCTTDERETS